MKRTRQAVLAILILMGLVSFVNLLFAKPEDCQASDECGTGYCKVWESNRYVCEPQHTSVAVWDRRCLEGIILQDDSRVESPLDEEGNPDLTKLTILHTKIKTKCDYRIEVRNR